MPLKKRLVDRDVLDARRRDVFIHIDNLVDHEKWVAMRQEFHDPRNVSGSKFRCVCGFVHNVPVYLRIIADWPSCAVSNWHALDIDADAAQ